MPAFIEHIRRVILRHHMLVAEDHVLVGVSGGADSVCTALVLAELGWRIGIAHLNHGLRGAESDEDEAFVAKLAAEQNAPFFAKRVNLRESRHNIEAAGRAARKEFFAAVQRECGYTRIALGHNRDDRVETFLLNLLRGAGPHGLASMAPTSESIVRPLIESPRVEIEAYLAARNQAWRSDRTNADMSFARNRLRHEVMPSLAAVFNSNLSRTLARTITVVADEDQFLRELTLDWMARHAETGAHQVSLPVRLLQAESTALVRRLLRASVERTGSNLTDLTFEQIESARRLLEHGNSGKTIELPGGTVATREFDKLVFRPKAAEPAGFCYTLQIPGTIHIPEAGRTIRASLVSGPTRGSDKTIVFVDAAKLAADRVEIRNWKAGDFYRPQGMASAKVKKLFQNARIPRGQRKSWPVVAQGTSLVWLVSLPVSRDYAAATNSEKIVAFEALQD